MRTSTQICSACGSDTNCTVYYNTAPNTDGIDAYRSDRVSLHNWDVTSGDDCVAIKGVSLLLSHILKESRRTLATLKSGTSPAVEGQALP